MPVVDTTKTNSNSLVQNLPSQGQNEYYGGLMGAAGQVVWPGGNFAQAPQYGGPLTAPQGQQTQNWYQNVNGLQTPQFGGLSQGLGDIYNQVRGNYQDPNSINFNTQYQGTQFQAPASTFQDPFAGYNGGGNGMQVQGPSVSGNAADWTASYDRVSAPRGVQAQQISNIPQLQAQQIGAFQMGPAQQVNAPNLRDFQMQAAGNVAPQAQVGTQSWTDPGVASSFMSPYTQNVLDAQKANMTADYQAQLVGQHAQAAQAGAFGGSRQAVQDAEAQRNLNLQMQNVEAQGLQGAYNQGAQQFNQQQQLGLQGQQFNVQSGLQAALANQANQQQANVQNLSSYLQTQGLGAQTGLQAGMANQQAGLTTGQANLGANMQQQALNQQQNFAAQQGNQQMSYQQQMANAQNALQAGIFNNQQTMQANLANQQAGLQTGMQGEQLGFQGAMGTAQMGMQGQLANQQANQAMLQRQYGAMGQQGNWGLQNSMQGQNLGMQAQQGNMQNNQFAANFGLNQDQAQQAARQAGINANYQGFGQEAALNQAQGNYAQMGFQNQAQQIGLQQNAAVNQQGYDQAAADRNYAYWQQQQQFPYQQLNWYSNLLHGLPAQGSTATAQQGVQYNIQPAPNWLNQAAGAAGTFAGYAAQAAGAAKGGLLEEPDHAYTGGGLASCA